MTNSSRQKSLFEDLDDLFDISDDTIIISVDDGLSGSTVTLDTANLNNYYINTNMSTQTSTISWDDYSSLYEIDELGKEWVHYLPDINRVEDMCKNYPGLDIAFKNFKTIYELVKDDYDSKKNRDLDF